MRLETSEKNYEKLQFCVVIVFCADMSDHCIPRVLEQFQTSFIRSHCSAFACQRNIRNTNKLLSSSVSRSLVTLRNRSKNGPPASCISRISVYVCPKNNQTFMQPPGCFRAAQQLIIIAQRIGPHRMTQRLPTEARTPGFSDVSNAAKKGGAMKSRPVQ